MPGSSHVGLFCITAPSGENWGGAINLTINNATVTGYSYVGVLIGASGTEPVDNITITGLVKLEAISSGVGCIAGYHHTVM